MYVPNEKDPSMLYEGLVRAAYGGCSKYGDPLGYAAQDLYTNFVGEITLRGKRALSATVIKVIIDYKQKEEAVKRLRKLDDRIWELKNQREVVEWLEALKEEMENLGYL